MVALLCKRSCKVCGNHRIRRTSLPCSPQMPDSGVEVTSLALQGTKHRVQCRRIAALGEGTFTDTHSIGNAA